MVHQKLTFTWKNQSGCKVPLHILKLSIQLDGRSYMDLNWTIVLIKAVINGSDVKSSVAVPDGQILDGDIKLLQHLIHLQVLTT